MSQIERQQENKKDAKKEAGNHKKGRESREEFRGFVNFKPNQPEKDEFAKWLEDAAKVADDTEQLLDDGWKIGLARDKSEGVFVPTIARWDVGHPESGIILNCRTKDAVSGHLRVVFALIYVFEYRLSPHIAGTGGDDLF